MLTSEKDSFVVRTKSKQTFSCKEQNVDLCKFGKTSRNNIAVGKNAQGSRIKPYLTSKGWLLWAYAAPLPSRLLTPPLTLPHASQSNKPSIKISFRPVQILHFIQNLYHSWVTVNAYIDRCPLPFVSIPNYKGKITAELDWVSIFQPT